MMELKKRVWIKVNFFTYFPTRADEFWLFCALSRFWCGFRASFSLWRYGFACFVVERCSGEFLLIILVVFPRAQKKYNNINAGA
jgi:hypothetical protein